MYHRLIILWTQTSYQLHTHTGLHIGHPRADLFGDVTITAALNFTVAVRIVTFANHCDDCSYMTRIKSKKPLHDFVQWFLIYLNHRST